MDLGEEQIHPVLALLELRFAGGAAYRYFRVPAPIYEELLRAESKGAYFNYHIRNRFACVKLPVAGPTGDS